VGKQIVALLRRSNLCALPTLAPASVRDSIVSMQTSCMQIANRNASRIDGSDTDLLRGLLTVDEVARRLNLARKTVRQLCLSRRLSAIRLQRSWRIPSAALDQFLRERLISSV
jgi:excisionase family DNA binding protein